MVMFGGLKFWWEVLGEKQFVLGFPLRVGDQIGTRKCAEFQSKSSSFYISHDNLFVDDNHWNCF